MVHSAWSVASWAVVRSPALTCPICWGVWFWGSAGNASDCTDKHWSGAALSMATRALRQRPPTRSAPARPPRRCDLEAERTGVRSHGVFIDRPYRGPDAPGTQMHRWPCEWPARNRVRSWDAAPYAVLIVYSGGVASCTTSPYRWAGLISPTPGSMVSQSTFTLATSSREASSVVLRRLAAGGHLLWGPTRWFPRNRAGRCARNWSSPERRRLDSTSRVSVGFRVSWTEVVGCSCSRRSAGFHGEGAPSFPQLQAWNRETGEVRCTKGVHYGPPAGVEPTGIDSCKRPQGTPQSPRQPFANQGGTRGRSVEPLPGRRGL